VAGCVIPPVQVPILVQDFVWEPEEGQITGEITDVQFASKQTGISEVCPEGDPEPPLELFEPELLPPELPPEEDGADL